MSEARKAATRALEIDDSLAEAHTSLANVRRLGDFDWAGAESGFKRAIELNPDYAPAHQFYAITLSATGRHTEAIAEVRRALELEPTSAVMIKNVARILYEARRYDEAITYYRQALEIDPGFSQAQREIGLAYEQKGMYEEAVSALEKALSLPGNYFRTTAQADLGHVYAVSGKRGDALRVLAELQELSEQSYVSPYDIAVVYAGLGDKEQALAWLHKSYEDRSCWLVWLKVDPRLDVLHSDSRFVELERRMGVAP